MVGANENHTFIEEFKISLIRQVEWLHCAQNNDTDGGCLDYNLDLSVAVVRHIHDQHDKHQSSVAEKRKEPRAELLSPV